MTRRRIPSFRNAAGPAFSLPDRFHAKGKTESRHFSLLPLAAFCLDVRDTSFRSSAFPQGRCSDSVTDGIRVPHAEKMP